LQRCATSASFNHLVRLALVDHEPYDLATSAPVGVFVKPSAIDLPGVRRASLDAATVVLLARRKLLGTLQADGRSPSGEAVVVAVGITQIRARLVTLAERSTELLSVRGPSTTAEGVLANHRANVALHERGVRMTSLFDVGASAEARSVIASLRGAPYHFCHGPVQLKILDRRCVIVDGPEVDGQPSIVALTAPSVVREALRYFRTVHAGAVPASHATNGGRGTARHEERDELTHRQKTIVALLAEELTDEAIAEALGVSVRTVRADIAALLRALHVRTRFAAGLRLGARAHVVGASAPALVEPSGQRSEDCSQAERREQNPDRGMPAVGAGHQLSCGGRQPGDGIRVGDRA
jgi:DNA-binding CsgD family transcriptional regulator